MRIRCKKRNCCKRLNANFEGFQHDKPLYTKNCECINRRRIDYRVLIRNTLLCVETYERQYNSYDKKDEENTELLEIIKLYYTGYN